MYAEFATIGKARCANNIVAHSLEQSAFKILSGDVCLIVLEVLLEGTTFDDDRLVGKLLTYRCQVSFVVMHARVVRSFDPIFVQTEKFGGRC